MLLTVANSFAIYIERTVKFYSQQWLRERVTCYIYAQYVPGLPYFTFRFFRLKFCIDFLYVHPVVSVSFLDWVILVMLVKGEGKAVPLQACSGPEGPRNLRFPDYMTTAQDGGKVVNPTHRPPLPQRNAPGIHFC